MATTLPRNPISSPTPPVAPSTPAFTVLVFNFRQVPDPLLQNAEETARRIFQRAGLQVTWRECPASDLPCHKGSKPVFFLALTAGPAQNKFLDTVAGHAVVDKQLAEVYYDYLPRGSTPGSASSDRAVILGCIISHELGHLLLGSGHSISGVMRDRWDVEQTRAALMSQLTFLAQEARVMQRSLREGSHRAEPAVSALVSRR